VIVLGVGGGIAAYKACELLRLLTESAHRVRVIPTAAALRFVGAPTWAALSGEPVTAEVWDDVHEVPHVAIGREAELVVVAPATADLLARAAHGIADDLLTGTLLTARCPILYAPAMHTEMWEHPATEENVRILRERGAVVLDPAVGRLTGPDSGPGRLPEPSEIFATAQALLRRGPKPPDLTGRRVVVTAGGTREPLDPIRFIGNRSSGKQGYAFARAAAARGAEVTVIAANVTLPDPARTKVIRVGSTEELRVAASKAAATADVVVMAAAPADFRPVDYSAHKIKKTGQTLTLSLVETTDIAAELGADKPAGQVLVVFAAETVTGAAALANARGKLSRKHADLVVLNEVGAARAFGTDTNSAVVLTADGATTTIGQTSKDELADAVLDLVVAQLTATTTGADGAPPELIRPLHSAPNTDQRA
jgi:phosphopantothenoylcysteine decarboxylase / phosphopantothenate---cysteine ligase